MGHRILVTGGAGYLGSILVPELLAAGHEVTVLDNFMYSQNSLAQVCANRNFRVVRGDIRIEPVLTPLLREAEIVIPLAAYVGAPLCARGGPASSSAPSAACSAAAGRRSTRGSDTARPDRHRG